MAFIPRYCLTIQLIQAGQLLVKERCWLINGKRRSLEKFDSNEWKIDWERFQRLFSGVEKAFWFEKNISWCSYRCITYRRTSVPMGTHCTQTRIFVMGSNKKPAKYIWIIYLIDVYTNMKGAMQYSTKGVNNDYVLCVSAYLPLHITYSYLPKVLPTTT